MYDMYIRTLKLTVEYVTGSVKTLHVSILFIILHSFTKLVVSKIMMVPSVFYFFVLKRA